MTWMNDPAPDLDSLLADVWQRLGRGRADRRSAFHTPVLATMGPDGPRQRVLVLRAVDPSNAVLRFNTDVRSGKIAAIGDAARVSVIGYDAGARVQISVSGTARVVADGPEADAAWATSALSSRRAYLCDPGPGTPIAEAGSGLPDDLTRRAPTAEEAATGRANFAVIMVTLDRIERVDLTAGGNRRAVFARGAGGWVGQWLIP